MKPAHKLLRASARSALSALALALLLPLSAPARADVAIAVSFGPPPLPVYEQPPIPGDGYIWTPGYWAYDDDLGDYYWVPGTWVLAPEPGYLWTPGYWAWDGFYFRWRDGYWGPRVGFYGGINYGYGYPGDGYWGGRWEGSRFYYNTAVNNVNISVVHYTYDRRFDHDRVVGPRVSFNGGRGGVQARPSPEQERWRSETHLRPTDRQIEQAHTAMRMPELRAGVNHGAPPIAATVRPGDFQPHAVVRARNAPTVSGPPPRVERPGPNARPEPGAYRGSPRPGEGIGSGAPQRDMGQAPGQVRGPQPTDRRAQPARPPAYPQARPQGQPQPQMQQRFEPQQQPRPQPQPQPQPRFEPRPQAQPHPQPQPQPRYEAGPQPRFTPPPPQAQPQPRYEPRPQPQPQPQGQPQPQPRYEPRPQPRSQPQAPQQGRRAPPDRQDDHRDNAR